MPFGGHGWKAESDGTGNQNAYMWPLEDGALGSVGFLQGGSVFQEQGI